MLPEEEPLSVSRGEQYMRGVRIGSMADASDDNDVHYIQYPEGPEVIYESTIMKCWHKIDTEFHSEESYVSIYFFGHCILTDVFNCQVNYYFVKSFNDWILEQKKLGLYDGITMKVQPTFYGFKVDFNGVGNVIFDTLLRSFIHLFTSFTIHQTYFERIQNKAIELIENIMRNAPSSKLAAYYRSVLLGDKWSYHELLEASRKVTLENVEEYMKRFRENTYMEMLVYGHLDRSETMKLVDTLQAQFLGRKAIYNFLPRQMLFPKFKTKIKNGVHTSVRVVTTPFQYSSAVCYVLYCGQRNVVETATMKLIEYITRQIFSAVVRNVLNRTEQDRSCLACSSTNEFRGHIYMVFLVESKRRAKTIDTVMQGCINNLRNEFDGMTEEFIDAVKRRLIDEMNIHPENALERANKYRAAFDSRDFDFNRLLREKQVIEQLTKNDIVRFYEQYMHESARDRSQFVILVQSTKN